MTVSKALVMSRKTAPTKLILSRALYHRSKQYRRVCVEREGRKPDSRGKRRLLELG